MHSSDFIESVDQRSGEERESISGRINEGGDSSGGGVGDSGPSTNCPDLDMFYADNNVEERPTASIVQLAKVELSNFSNIIKTLNKHSSASSFSSSSSSSSERRNFTIDRIDSFYPLESIIGNILELENILEEFCDCQVASCVLGFMNTLFCMYVCMHICLYIYMYVSPAVRPSQ